MIKLTPALAAAAACDAADAQMRNAGRTTWNRADYNFACTTQARLILECGTPARCPSFEALD